MGSVTTSPGKPQLGVVIKANLVKNLSNLPKGFNVRLLVMQLSLANRKRATIISAHALAMTNPDDGHDKFYEKRDFLISSISKSDKRPISSSLTSMPELDVTM